MPATSITLRRLALTALLSVVPLVVACDSDITRPEIPRELPILYGVTAPDIAAPGSDVLVRMHWGVTNCNGVSFEGFRVWTRTDGVRTLVPEWRWPTEPVVCLAGIQTIVWEETTLLRMPATGPLEFAIQLGDRTMRRTIQPGTAPVEPVWTLEIASASTGQPADGQFIEFFQVEVEYAEGPVWQLAIVDTLLADTLDATGRLRVDTNVSNGARTFLLRVPEIGWRDFAIPLIEPAPPGQVAERSTLVF